MKGILIVLLLVVLAAIVLMTGETAESYCEDNWTTVASDYESCVEWYRDNEPGPGER